MTQFEHAVKKQEEIENLKKENKELKECLESFRVLFSGNFHYRERMGVNSIYNRANELLIKK